MTSSSESPPHGTPSGFLLFLPAPLVTFSLLPATGPATQSKAVPCDGGLLSFPSGTFFLDFLTLFVGLSFLWPGPLDLHVRSAQHSPKDFGPRRNDVMLTPSSLRLPRPYFAFVCQSHFIDGCFLFFYVNKSRRM